MDPLVGAVVSDRYRILGRIGAGGMGAVYRVEHLQIGKIAAMKLLHGELSRDQSMVRRFNREARAVSRLSNPHTVSVFDYGRSAGLVYIVMELLSGRDLSNVLREEGPLSPERVACIVAQIASSLSEAHGLGIVHRDLKPQNVFLCEGPEGETDSVKVLDFGLAKLVESRDESLDVTQTQVGVVMGTPHYMSPEQIRDRPIDHRADIYSLGTVAYRLLTGEPPFQHQKPLGILHMHLNEPVPSLTEYDVRLGPVDRVMRKAMAKEPQERYARVTGFADDLSSAIAATSMSAGPPRLRISGDSALVDPSRIGTRQEFEVFERRLRSRRAMSVVFTVATVLVVLFAAYRFASGDFAVAGVSEREPNDDLGTATYVRAGRAVAGIAGSVGSPAPDRDVFELRRTSSAHGILDASVAAVPGIDFVLEAVGENGEIVVRTDGGAVGEGESIPNLGVHGDSVYLVVRSRAEDAGTPRDYVVVGRFRSPFIEEEAEPNDGRPEALAMAVRSGVHGMIGWPGDRDRYQVDEGEQGGRFRFELSAVPDVDLAMEISDRPGTLVERIDDAGAGGREVREIDLDATRFVGAPILTVSAAADQHSHLVYRLVVSRVGEGR